MSEYKAIFLVTHDTVDNSAIHHDIESAQHCFTICEKIEALSANPRPTYLYIRIRSFNRELTLLRSLQQCRLEELRRRRTHDMRMRT